MSTPASPTTFSPALSREFAAKVHLKPEIHGATGSYKDRIGPAAVAEALAAGAAKVVVTSSGNQGLAIAHAARAAGVPCLVLATQDILPVYQQELRRLGADLQLVPDMKARSALLHEKIAAGYFPLSVAPEDRGRAVQSGKSGYAAIAREIVAALGAAPDYLILPVCFGDGCSGILRGFAEMARERGTGIPIFIMARAKNTEEVAFSITADITTPEVATTLAATRGVPGGAAPGPRGRARSGTRRRRAVPRPAEVRRPSGSPRRQHGRPPAHGAEPRRNPLGPF